MSNLYVVRPVSSKEEKHTESRGRVARVPSFGSVPAAQKQYDNDNTTTREPNQLSDLPIETLKECHNTGPCL